MRLRSVPAVMVLLVGTLVGCGEEAVTTTVAPTTTTEAITTTTVPATTTVATTTTSTTSTTTTTVPPWTTVPEPEMPLVVTTIDGTPVPGIGSLCLDVDGEWPIAPVRTEEPLVEWLGLVVDEIWVAPWDGAATDGNCDAYLQVDLVGSRQSARYNPGNRVCWSGYTIDMTVTASMGSSSQTWIDRASEPPPDELSSVGCRERDDRLPVPINRLLGPVFVNIYGELGALALAVATVDEDRSGVVSFADGALDIEIDGITPEGLEALAVWLWEDRARIDDFLAWAPPSEIEPLVPYLIATYADNGIGMPPGDTREVLERITGQSHRSDDKASDQAAYWRWWETRQG